jgi:hypothetical protein
MGTDKARRCRWEPTGQGGGRQDGKVQGRLESNRLRFVELVAAQLRSLSEER